MQFYKYAFYIFPNIQNLAYFDELVTTVEQTNDVANATVKLLKLMRTSTELTLYPGALSEALKELKVDFTNTNELLTTIIHTLSPDLRDLFSYKMCATCAFSTDTISHYKSISDISTPKCDGCKVSDYYFLCTYICRITTCVGKNYLRYLCWNPIAKL